MRIRYRLEAGIFAVISAVASRLQLSAMVRLGEFLGAVAGRLARRHTRIAQQNLEKVFGPSMTPDERRDLVRKCWRHFGRIILEALYFPRRSAEDIGRDIIIEGREHIEAAYANNKGAFLFSAHFGNWELVALMQGFMGLPLTLLGRELDNPLLEKHVAALRTLSGNRLIHKQHSVREMIRIIKRGDCVAIVTDQDARAGGIFVPFLGLPSSTTPTLASLALRTGATIVPVFSLPQPGGGYRIIYEPAVRFEPGGDHDRDVENLTIVCNRILERWIRKYPQYWLWMHRRWKTAPPEVKP